MHDLKPEHAEHVVNSLERTPEHVEHIPKKGRTAGSKDSAPRRKSNIVEEPVRPQDFRAWPPSPHLLLREVSHPVLGLETQARSIGLVEMWARPWCMFISSVRGAMQLTVSCGFAFVPGN